METTEITPVSKMSAKEKILVKGIIVFIMVFVLWLPTNIILNLVKERAARQKEVTTDISSKWASKQVITGPVLMVPYKTAVTNDKGVIVWEERPAYFMPDKLDIKSSISPEKRHRGIYEVAVYRSDINLSGSFSRVNWQALDVTSDLVMWDKAMLLFSVKDNIKGLNEDLHIKWNDSSLLMSMHPNEFTAFPDAFAVSVPLTAGEALQDHPFSLQFSVNGSEQLLFNAIARENKLTLQSSWPNPGFTGVKLPDTRTVNNKGFTASWKYLNRTIPPVWKDTRYDLSSSQLGTDLVVLVDSYDKTERSVKYALLCIFLTFAAFFLVETIYKRALHPVQYGLAGMALVLFYTLLLSVSEYTGYNLAYLLAGVATIGLITWYIGSVMHSSRLAIFIGFVLAVVYTYIFTIIQLEDYALLMGSIGLFAALGIIMFFSRKLQWQIG